MTIIIQLFIFFLILNIFSPKRFLLLYALFITSFLGFIDNTALVFGYDIGQFIINISMLLFYLFKRPVLTDKYFKYLDLIIIIYIFGISRSVLIDFSSFQDSVIGSKSFSSIFLLHYLLSNKEYINNEYLLKIIFGLTLYFLLIFIFAIFFDLVPPEYYKEGFLIEIDYLTIFALGVIIISAKDFNFPLNLYKYFLIIIFPYLLIKEGHISILFTIAISSLLLLFFKEKLFLIKFSKIKLFFLIILLIPIAYIFDSFIIDYLYNNIVNLDSISSRILTNKIRVEYILEKPFLGYGFSSFSSIQFDTVNQFSNYLSTIDNGYHDLLIKFGLIVSSLYLFCLYKLTIPDVVSKQNFPLVVFMILLLFINLTWSVFTYEIGIISLSFALFLNLNSNNKINSSEFKI